MIVNVAHNLTTLFMWKEGLGVSVVQNQVLLATCEASHSIRLKSVRAQKPWIDRHGVQLSGMYLEG